jgi:hypothetical protein
VTPTKQIKKLVRMRLFKDNYDSKEAGWTGPFVHHEEVASSINYSNLIAEITARKSRKVDFV